MINSLILSRCKSFKHPPVPNILRAFGVMYLLAKLKPFEQKEHFSLKEQNGLGGI